MSLLTALRCSLVLTLFTGCVPLEDELGHAEHEVVKGTPVVGYPNAGSLQRARDGNLPGMICTGTLIGCDTFLTAAHCVCDRDDKGDPCGIPTPAEELSVYFQHGGIFEVASVEAHPDFDFPDNDIAVVRLAEPVIGIKPAPLVLENPALDAQLTIVGFGITVKGGIDGGIKREGALQRTACAYQRDDLMLCYDPEESPTVSCNGDSGGPNYLEIDGVQHVAGIVSGGGTSTSCAERQKFATGVYAHLPFVVEHSGELGQERCGDIASVEEPGSVVLASEGEGTRVSHSVEVPAGTAELRIGANALRGSKLGLALAHESEPDYIVDDCGGEGRMSSYCQVLSPEPGTWNVVVSSDTEHQIAMTTLPGAPLATTDLYEAISGSALRIEAGSGLLTNDFGGRDPELYSVVSVAPRYGSVEIEPDGSFVYQSEPGFVGTDSFSYRVHEEPYSAETRVFVEVREEVLGDCGCQTSSPRYGGNAALVLFALLAAGRRRRKLALAI